MELVYKRFVGQSFHYCYYDYCLLYLIWASNNETFRVTLLHLVDNTNTLSEQHWQQTVLDFQILNFLWSPVYRYVTQPLCLRVCMQSISIFFLVAKRFAVIFEPKNDKDTVTSIEWVRLSSRWWPNNGSEAAK